MREKEKTSKKKLEFSKNPKRLLVNENVSFTANSLSKS